MRFHLEKIDDLHKVFVCMVTYISLLSVVYIKNEKH